MKIASEGGDTFCVTYKYEGLFEFCFKCCLLGLAKETMSGTSQNKVYSI